MEITRTALVLHPADDMFRLVRDVAAYPHFLTWCRRAEVHEQDHGLQVATLEVRVGGVNQEFTTRNRLVAGESISMALAEGPFRRLTGEWRFEALGETGSKVSLFLAFDFSSRVLSSAFRRGFMHIADKLVQDFSQRADEVYGIGQ